MTLHIETFTLGALETNCYLLTYPESNQAIVVDPGMDPESLLNRVQDLEVAAILLTHAHFDHIGGVDQLRKLKKCPVYLHEAEADWLTDPDKNGSAMWPHISEPIITDPAEFTLQDGQMLHLAGISLKVLHTPGHSPGSVSFLHDDFLIGGDVLFRLSVGRTDLLGGSSLELYESIHSKLFKLPDGLKVYPGHGPSTTIGYEKLNNPYV